MINNIKQLRENIKKKIPQDYLKLRTVQGGGHIYHAPVHGVDLLSVTTKLKVISNPFFDSWRMNKALEYISDNIDKKLSVEKLIEEARQHPQKLFEGAAAFGSKVHDLADEYFSYWIENDKPMKNILDLIPKEKDYRVWSALRSLEKWVQDNNYEPLGSELQVWSIKHQIAGTLDNIGLVDKKHFVMIDLKTSNAFQDTYWFQVVSYGKMFEELTSQRIYDYHILKLDKSQGIPQTEQIEDVDKLFEEVLNIFSCYDAVHRVNKARKTAGKKIVRI